MINRAIIVGRLTKDCEVKMTASGTKVCRFTVACDKQNGCDFIPCTAFDKTAEVIGTYGKKGKPVGVDGRINVDRNDKGTYISVVAQRITLIGGKNEETPTEQPTAPYYSPKDLEELPF